MCHKKVLQFIYYQPQHLLLHRLHIKVSLIHLDGWWFFNFLQRKLNAKGAQERCEVDECRQQTEL